ncbi:PAS domain-containing protein [Microvirga pudoricolor]|uniref:PAS domain-containing protein n=1 Tax=Microvirga pudoricolor TaxID=2778729 RepID=UPI0019520D52|nr:PAS domain-containing protein [Microvirga pudoricolor]MBM6592967.1 PAS domain-containing protein [Microvirga pudoricolor]
MALPDNNPGEEETSFPAGGGETGKLIRTFDWSGTSLGPISGWPQSLKTSVDICLRSPVPIVMLWGPEGYMIYNDPYSGFAGRRHPWLLGSKVLEGWAEVADFNANVMRVCLAGETLTYRDQHLVLYRNGYAEDVWMDLHYSPILDESQKPAGVFAIVVETSERVRAQLALVERGEQLRLAQEAGGIGTFALEVATNLMTVTPEFCRLYGIDLVETVRASEIERLIVPEDKHLISNEISRSVGTADSYAEYRVRQPSTGRIRWIARQAEFVRDPAGKPIRLVGASQDITARKEAENALRVSKERLSHALNAAGMVGTWDWHIPTDTFYSDAKFAEMYSVDPAKAESGARLSEYLAGVHPDDIPRITESIEHTLRTGEPYSQEYRLLHKDGTIRWIIARGECHYDAMGRPVRFPGAVVDVTDRKQAELALVESEGRFRNMADHAPALIWACDANRKVAFANRRYETDFGVSPEQLARGGWHEMVHGDDESAFAASFREAFEARAIFRAEVRVWDRYKRLRWLRCEGVPRFDETGEFLGYVGCNVDITEARLARDMLAAEVEQRTRELESVWRVSRDLFCVVGPDGTYRSVNPAWTEVLGYRPEELVGIPHTALVHPDDAEAVLAAFERLPRVGTIEVDLRIRLKSGEYRWFNWTGVADEGVYYAAGRDIDLRKQLEEQLRQSQKMEAVGQLTGGIAHDFNNLLTGIIGSLDLMQTRMAQGRYDTLERYAKAAVSSANRAAALTHRLLAFARRQPLDPKPVNVNQLVTSMEDLLRRSLGETITLELVTSGGLWLTLCDPNQLENALLNLVINGRDAMPEGGKLIIETANAHLDNVYAAAQRDVTPGQYVCLCVSDTGAGMSADVIARAFDPFFTTKPIGQGTGLGLSMVYGFAKQSEGHARIYSELGEGTTIRLYLPRYRGKVEGEAAPAPEPMPRAEDGEVVLVVEDEPVVRGLVVDILKDLGYRAIEASDGPSGLRALESDLRVDLLVTDVGLPGLNGRELADKAREKRPSLKVLFITGYAENAAIASGFLAPGMEMITKPFAIDVLAKRIRDMIER